MGAASATSEHHVTGADRAGDSPAGVTLKERDRGKGDRKGVASSEGGSQPTKASGRSFKLGNRPPLTGIRAVFLALVVVYHSNNRTFPGAWIALGLFFTLSGFLITSMLMGERQRTGGISLRNFYLRRGLRLLPPLFLTIGLIAIYAAFFPVGDAAQRVWGDAAAATFYFADYRSALGHEPFLGFLGQTWSLSVEEQFYLVWSVFLALAMIKGRRSLAYAMAITGLLACTGNRLRIVLTAPHLTLAVIERTYYAFDTRADAIFLGCVLGLLATGGHLSGWGPWAKRLLTAVAAVSVGVLAYIAWYIHDTDPNLSTVWIPVSEVTCAILLTYFVVNPQGWGSRLAGLGFLVLLGDMTYTIYLVHWPVYLAVTGSSTGWSYWPTEALRLAIIAVIAAFSWYVIEKPLNRWRRRALSERSPQAKPAGVGAAP